LFEIIEFFEADDCSASWEPVAAEEGAFFALSDDEQTFFALIAFYACGLWRRFWREEIAFFVEFYDSFAVGIIGAAEELSETAVSINKRFAAYRAFVFAYLLLNYFSFLVAGAGEFAFWVGGAAQEFSIFAEPVDERLSALRALVFAWCGFGFCVSHLFRGGIKVLFEWAVKFFQDANPVEVLLFNLVELLFHISCKSNVHNFREILVELISNHLAEVCGEEFLFVLLDVFSFLNGANNGGIGAGSADTFLFEGLYE